MKEDVRMSESIVNSTTQIANAICKKKGYTMTFNEIEVAIVLKAYLMLIDADIKRGSKK